MTSKIEDLAKEMAFTGERFMPEVAGQIAFEHLHRYHYAAQYCKGKQVLDVACGEGYGSRIISLFAESVVGADIAAEAVAHAQARYGNDTSRFVEASAASLPFNEDSFDVVVSFETIEHHDQHEQMLAEIRRVLRPGGKLVISSPNKQYYSVETGYANPYHVKELFRDELVSLVGKWFEHLSVLSQRVVHGSLLIAEGHSQFDSIFGVGGETCEWSTGLSRPLYDLVIASDSPLPEAGSSFFELNVHDLDAATFYGVHLPERVQRADQDVLRLQAELESVQARLQVDGVLEEQVTLRSIIESLHDEVRKRLPAADANALHAQLNALQVELHGRLKIEDELLLREALTARQQELQDLREDHKGFATAMAAELRHVRDAHRAEVEHLRESREEVHSSLSALGSLIEAVRREGSEQRQLQEARLHDALKLNRQLIVDAVSIQSSNFDHFNEQFAQVNGQLARAVGDAQRVQQLERLLVESQEVVLAHVAVNEQIRSEMGAMREQLISTGAQREAALMGVQQLQLTVTEQTAIIERRERDMELLKSSRSWRYTAWLRIMFGSARRHL